MPVPICTKAKLSTSRPWPERPFGQGGGVHIVLHHQRWPERLAQPGQRRRAVPAAQPAGELHGVPARVVDAGTADHGLGDGRTGHARVLAQQSGQLDQLGDPGPDAGGVGAQGGPGPDLAGEVGDRAADVLVPDIQAEHQPGVGPDLVQPGRTTGHAGPLPGDADQARPLHVVQGQGHGGLGQAGNPGQLGPRARATLADVLQQQLLVHRPDQRGTRREQARTGAVGRSAGRKSRHLTPGGRVCARIVRQGCHCGLPYHRAGHLALGRTSAAWKRHSLSPEQRTSGAQVTDSGARKLRPCVSSSGALSRTDS